MNWWKSKGIFLFCSVSIKPEDAVGDDGYNVASPHKLTVKR